MTMDFSEAEAKKKEMKAKMLELWAWFNRGEPIYSDELSQKMAEFKAAFEAYISTLEDQMRHLLGTASFDSMEFQAVLQRELGELLTLLDGMMPTNEDKIQ